MRFYINLIILSCTAHLQSCALSVRVSVPLTQAEVLPDFFCPNSVQSERKVYEFLYYLSNLFYSISETDGSQLYTVRVVDGRYVRGFGDGRALCRDAGVDALSESDICRVAGEGLVRSAQVLTSLSCSDELFIVYRYTSKFLMNSCKSTVSTSKCECSNIMSEIEIAQHAIRESSIRCQYHWPVSFH